MKIDAIWLNPGTSNRVNAMYLVAPSGYDLPDPSPAINSILLKIRAKHEISSNYKFQAVILICPRLKNAADTGIPAFLSIVIVIIIKSYILTNKDTISNLEFKVHLGSV